MNKDIQKHIAEHIEVASSIDQEIIENIDTIANLIVEALKNNNTSIKTCFTILHIISLRNIGLFPPSWQCNGFLS